MNSKREVHNRRSEKIDDLHLDQLAVVYVRQSTLQQVLEHQESTRLQYGLVGAFGSRFACSRRSVRVAARACASD